MKKLIITLAAMLAFAASAVETSIAYQGVLKNAAGTEAITGSQKITFRLYTEATGGTALWESTKSVTLDANGLFSVELADDSNPKEGTPRLADALREARGGTLYIGLEVKDSAGEILPRQKILMVPYASYAADVSYASDEFVVDGKATLKSAEIDSAFIANGTAEFRDKATFAQEVTFSGNVTAKDSATITAKTINATNGNGIIPVGGIIMWSGAIKNIPAGWALCDGNDGRPNLTSRFIVGAKVDKANYSDQNEKDGEYYTGQTGGYNEVKLALNQIPKHRHEYAGDDQLVGIDSECTEKIRLTNKNSAYDADSRLDMPKEWQSKVYGTSYEGGDSTQSDRPTVAHENRPPYYALAFIMRVK